MLGLFKMRKLDVRHTHKGVMTVNSLMGGSPRHIKLLTNDLKVRSFATREGSQILKLLWQYSGGSD